MICVSIGRTRHKMMIAEHQSLAQGGAELVELRLDWLSKLPDLGRLIRDRPTPVVVTCRRAQDKGLWKNSEEQRLTLLRSAVVAGVEYVDIELDVATQVRRYGPTKRIISYHNFEETPFDLDAIYDRAAKADPDVIKIVTMANTPTDGVRILKLGSEAKIPTIAFCMGELGVFTRILCGKYGAPFTYATFHRDRELAPGQLAFDEMRNVYHYDRINRDTEVYGVLADPVAHSLSPLIHNAAFRALGLNKVYVPFRVPQDALSISLESFRWLGVKGYSVTIPHKEAAVAKARLFDGPVEAIGALNTLYRGDDKVWHGANTDVEAALACLRHAMTGSPDPRDPQFLAGRKVLILGAGGVARAIGYGVIQAGGGLTIANRTHDRAVQLARQLGCQQVTWENRASVFADVLINCTAVGMHPDVNSTPFAENWLREGMYVFDTVYNPENTLLIKQARLRDCQVILGTEMFVRQASLQFERFTGIPAPADVIESTLRRKISPVKMP